VISVDLEEFKRKSKEIEDLVGKKVVIFYDDGTSVSRKDGILIKQTEDFIYLQSSVNSSTILIPLDRLVRIEIND